MNLTDVLSNTNGWGTGFAAGTSTWAYPWPPSYYFWAGFTLVFASGMVMLAFRWVRNIIGGNPE